MTNLNSKMYSENLSFKQEEAQRRQEETHCLQLAEKRQSLKKTSHLIAINNKLAVGVKSDGTITKKYFKGAIIEYLFAFGIGEWRNITAVAPLRPFGGFAGIKSDGTVVSTCRYCYDNIFKRFFKMLFRKFCKKYEWEKWSDIVDISTPQHHWIAGLASNGRIFGCLFTSNKNAGMIKSGWKDIIALTEATSDYERSRSLVGLKSNGTVETDDDDLFVEVVDWRDIVAVANASKFIVGLKSDGTVVTTWNTHQMKNFTDIVAVAADYDIVVGLKLDGTVVTTDENLSKKVADWNDIVAVACVKDKYDAKIAGLKSDGSVVVALSNGGNILLNWKLSTSDDYEKNIRVDAMSPLERHSYIQKKQQAEKEERERRAERIRSAQWETQWEKDHKKPVVVDLDRVAAQAQAIYAASRGEYHLTTEDHETLDSIKSMRDTYGDDWTKDM